MNTETITRVVPVELLPCPFCALSPELRTDGCGDYYVSCVDDDCAGSAQPDGDTGDVARASMSRVVAISAWNTRPAPPPPSTQPKGLSEHIEQRLLTWRQRTMNKSDDRLALDDYMDKEAVADLIDFVCDESAIAPPATQADDARRTFIIINRPGLVPVRKGPCFDKRHTEAMLRELYALHPDCTLTVIEMPTDCYPDSGIEWLDIHGDGRKKRVAQANVQQADARDAGSVLDDLEWFEQECLDLRCMCEQGDDPDVFWVVIEHHMSEPREREIGRGTNPVRAIKDARKSSDDPTKWSYVPPADIEQADAILSTAGIERAETKP